MQLTSSAFRQGEPIPDRFTCEGGDTSPEFAWEGAPQETQSFVLILHDPDAPRANGFTHWVAYNIPANVTKLPENAPKQGRIDGLGMQGKNDGGRLGYVGPCPPSGTHRYFARLYALNAKLALEPGATHEQVSAAMEPHVIDECELMGTYTKKGTRRVA